MCTSPFCTCPNTKAFDDPFDPEVSLTHTGVGAEKADEARPVQAFSREAAVSRAVESAVVQAVFGGCDHSRRAFLQRVGGAAALGIIGSIFPLDAIKALAQEKSGPPEKKDLKIGFIPITCGTPIIMAEPMGFYAKHGLAGTQVTKAAGWAMIRDWAVAKQVDCAHMLSPMPLALTLGAGAEATPFIMPAIENINGQAITLHKDHKNVKGPQDMKGFTFCVPFDYSMHNMLLRYYLAEGGVDPDRDVKIRVVPPPEMVANLKAKNIDGYLAPDPFNQRAVYEEAGFIFKLSKELWPGHPCCGFAMPAEFAKTMPNSFKAVFNAIVDATLYCSEAKNRKDIAAAVSPRNYLNQPLEVVEQVLLGQYPDGLGNNVNDPERIDFNPMPWQSMAVWILSQMKRWGYLKGEVNYKIVAEQVYLAAGCADLLRARGKSVPDNYYQKYKIMGKEFDPADPEGYIASFAIKRT